ncbi:hypothetical protein RND81_02G186100 [Saponaria officinalis]|uniref:Carboxypeptidase n=1 Tax=Saponaria officinalis TaxID=3572 RepID=A0AAW1MNN7_SAPOF
MNLLIFTTLLYFHACTSSSIPDESLPTKSGYLEVNSTSGSSIFYAFYEAKEPVSELAQTPLLIWLQGGPGCSSMTGNFYELGPWWVNHSLKLEPNPGSWNRIFGLLFLDNPIGTGFSVAGSPEEIPRNQYDVARHLYIAIRSFIKLDYKLFGSRPVYITGESYAGKYVPSIGYYILRKNSEVSNGKRINLAGVAVGNGLTDPETQVKTHGVNAYFSGLINEKQRAQLEEGQTEVVNLIEGKKWSEATNARTTVLRMLQNMTGLATLYDLRRQIPYESGLVEQFLRNVEVRKALGVTERSRIFEGCSDVVAEALHEDVMKSVKYKVEYLLKESKVLLYQGQTDLRDGVVSVEAYMRKLKWDGIDKFREAGREVWRVKGKVAGYVQKWGSLSHVVVLGAGHFVPTDQPVHSQAMIEDWVLGKGLFADRKIESTLQRL